MADLTQTGGISPDDIYLFHEGTNYRSYRMLGAHLTVENGSKGVRFTVWAPHAAQVGLACDRNGWNGSGEEDTLVKIPDSGIWSRFFAGIEPGTYYKYRITTPDGDSFLKADPYAFQAEVRPATASVVADLGGYRWGDGNWRRRNKSPYQKPLNIYEMHLGTWRQKEGGELYTYREIADLLVPYLLEMGYTHVEFMPLAEHPYDLSWGYQGTGYFAATSRFGAPQDLMYLIDRCHQAGIGVILDWVPAHFAKDAHGLRRFDGSPLYEYSDPLLAEKPGWGTLSFDFSKPEVRSFLISNALFWYELFHIDGMRVDAVTSMLRLDFEKHEGQYRLNLHGGKENLEAIAFLQQLNRTIFEYYPHALMMAEESSAWPGVTASVHEGGLGFNYKWNMGWMNDTLAYIEEDFASRPHRHNLLTFPICYAYSENYTLPLSHDEVVHGKKSLLDKMPGTYEQKFAGLRTLLGYQMTHPGKKLLFMGGEFGQFIEWKDQDQLDWFLLDYDSHRKTQAYTAALNKLYLTEKALWELDHDMDGYQWISADDSGQSVLSYIRRGKKPSDTLIVLVNFQPVPRYAYRIGIPKAGTYEEVFSSDSVLFGGEGLHNLPMKTSKREWHGQLHSLEVNLPPLSFLVLKKTSRRGAAAEPETVPEALALKPGKEKAETPEKTRKPRTRRTKSVTNLSEGGDV